MKFDKIKIVSLKNISRFCTAPKNNANVCIVGAGPAGFYAAMHLSKHLGNVTIDIIEKLPVPFGLIRYGVAPDHPEVKNVINQFSKVAQQNNVNFYGNISLGRDLTLSQLRQNYDAVLLTYGAEEDKTLGIENENANNIIAARRFVGWYNGLPQDRDLKIDLNGTTAAILGMGNVSLDVARILLTPIDDLKKTDITEHALSALSTSKIKELLLVGRRGPLQVAFTIKELREQLKLKGCHTIWNKEDFNGVADIAAELPRPRKRLTELMLKSLSEMDNVNINKNNKLFKPVFCRSPNKFILNGNGAISAIEVICNKLVGDKLQEQTCIATNDKAILECQLAFRSIGYKSVNVDNIINFDNAKGIVLNDRGKVSEDDDTNLAKLYVAGWLATGPVGVIIHTMGHAFQVAKTICEDLSKEDRVTVKPGFIEVQNILRKKNIQIVDWAGWEKIDKFEIDQGKKKGKPREKICSIDIMLEIASK